MDTLSTTSTNDALSTATGHATFAYTPPTAPTATAMVMGDDGMGDMVGMDGMDMSDGDCKISMLWNWNTIDACFLSTQWQIKSAGGFAALCIGVILMVVLLEVLRRTSKMYDRYIIRQHRDSGTFASSTGLKHQSPEPAVDGSGELVGKNNHLYTSTSSFRPNVYQQTVRALLHTLQFTLAYWIMLLAMYYNGYIIISIIIGAFIGSFIFQWERIGQIDGSEGGPAGAEEVTGCCG